MTWEKLKRKAGIYFRQKSEAETIIFAPTRIAKFRFYQFTAATAAFFYSRLGKTDIRVIDTPHFALARALAEDPEKISTATEHYVDYLAASWRTNDWSRLMAGAAEFRSHFESFAAGTGGPAPVLTSLQPDDEFYVVDGNHRTAFALALGRNIRSEVWPADLAFLKYSNIKEFYGTGHRNLPYQSLFLSGKEVIKGRRGDVLERLHLIPRPILQGRKILDIASNVGMSSLLARSLGALSCLGLEISSDMVDLASRFAMFEGAYPEVQFRQFNLDEDKLSQDQLFETAFMFSIHDHLRNPKKLQEIARHNVTKYVVFEGHPNADRATYNKFFDSGLFRSVSEIGALSESIFRQKKTRTLWLCEK